MVFSSIPFLFVFFPLCLIMYYLVPGKIKNLVLLVFSLVFYAWGEPVYIVLMLVETLSDYLVGRIMIKTKHKKACLVWSICFDLLILCFFKYANFLIGMVNSVTPLDIPALDLALPIGISFYTFQTLSYIIDLYRGEVEAEKSYINYLTYVSMFPQLVAGPIVRYSSVQKQLVSRKIDVDKVVIGFLRFLKGLFKKVLLANQIGSLWEMILAQPDAERSILSAWLGAIAFTFQIYYDFSGYSDMAIGMGKMLGFDFDENFKHPLMSLSITDFWRRWHISLSSWFKSYVYIPLGGNRRGTARQVRNILIVWMLTGFWHGASWNFIFWGLYYGVLLLVEKLVLGKWIDRWPKVIRHIYSFVIVAFGFVLFAIDDMGQLGGFIASMFAGNGFVGNAFMWQIQNYGILLLLCFFGMGLMSDDLRSQWEKNRVYKVLQPVIVAGGVLLSIACLVNNSYNPFLYFRF